MFRRAWGSYLNRLKTKPLSTNIATSAAITVVGDSAAQYLTYRQRRKHLHSGSQELTWQFDPGRTLTMAGWGCILAVPAFFWYKWLDRVFVTTNFLGLCKKVAFNVLTFSTTCNVMYFGYLKAVHHLYHDGVQRWLREWRQKTVDDIKHTTVNAIKLWSVAHIINFQFVPAKFRIVYMNLIGAGWSCFLSLVGYKDAVPSVYPMELPGLELTLLENDSTFDDDIVVSHSLESVPSPAVQAADPKKLD